MRRRAIGLAALILGIAACGSSTRQSTGSGGGGGAGTASASTTTGAGGVSASSAQSGSGGSPTGSGTGGILGVGGADAGCASTPTFTEILTKPLSGCSGLEPPCHNLGAAMLTINTTQKTATWNQLVNVPAYTAGAGERVVPGDPAHSFLYRKITDDLTPSEGSPMPKSGLASGWNELPASEIEMMRCWILGGAKND